MQREKPRSRPRPSILFSLQSQQRSVKEIGLSIFDFFFGFNPFHFETCREKGQDLHPRRVQRFLECGGDLDVGMVWYGMVWYG